MRFLDTSNSKSKVETRIGGGFSAAIGLLCMVAVTDCYGLATAFKQKPDWKEL